MKNLVTAILHLCVTACVFTSLSTAQINASSIHLTNQPKTVWETEDPSVDLQGSASMDGAIQSVRRAITGIPLRLGLNSLAISVTDVPNSSRSLHFAIYRKTAPGTEALRPLEVRTGTWEHRSITYQLRKGMAIVEGDIILAPAATFSGDAALQSEHSPVALWPLLNSVAQVPYVLHADSGANADAVKAAIANLNSLLSHVVVLVRRTDQPNYVNINVEASGSSEGFSSLGMVGGAQSLDCGSACTVESWSHEIVHTIGLLHEQQRPDGSNFISLNLKNADLPSVPGGFDLFSFDNQAIGLYDHSSIMHAGAFDFSKAGRPVIESIPAGIPMGEHPNGTTLFYSPGDIDRISRLYGTTPRTVTLTTNPTGLGYVVDGQEYQGTTQFSWALNSVHSISVLRTRQMSQEPDGSPDGAIYEFGSWNDLGAPSHTITVSPGNGSLTSPSVTPATTVYQANFVRLLPFVMPEATPEYLT